MPLDVALARNGLFAVLGGVATLGVRAVLRRLWAADCSPWALGGSVLACSVAGGVGAALVLNPLYAAQMSIDLSAAGPRVWFGGAVNFGLVYVAWCLLYLGGRYALDLQAERERVLRARTEATEARLEALHYQIRPHLLFNVLNSVAALILEEQTRPAYRMVLRLSDVLRQTLDRPATGTCRLADELDYLRAYLALERIRFDERLRVQWDVAPAAADWAVPTFLLQPLVENALKHAVAVRTTGGTIAVRADRTGETLRLDVADDGPGFDSQADQGVGLSNLRRRLDVVYDGAATLDFASDPELGGARVRVSLPATPAEDTSPAPPPPDAARSPSSPASE
jgi:signal transduction histidine kinase